MKKNTSSHRKTETKKSTTAKKTGKSTAPQNHLRNLLVNELKDIFWAEKALVKALSKIEKSATSNQLKDAVQSHLEETEGHATKLERVFEALNEKVVARKCDAMEGLIKESLRIIDETEDGTYTRDAGLILAAQKIEHYEIATYGCLIALAKTLDETDAADILDDILSDEKNADRKLSEIAEDYVNQEALKESEGVKKGTEEMEEIEGEEE